MVISLHLVLDEMPHFLLVVGSSCDPKLDDSFFLIILPQRHGKRCSLFQRIILSIFMLISVTILNFRLYLDEVMLVLVHHSLIVVL